MFGYITADAGNLSKEEKSRYKAHYCGLCHILKEKYGSIGTSMLSYDMTFLEMVLSDLNDDDETAGSERCVTHPLKEHSYAYTESTRYTADMQMILSFYSALDDVEDEGKSQGTVRKLAPFMDDLRAKYPRQCEAIEREVKALKDDPSKDPVELSKHSGIFTGEVFVMDESSFFRDDLRALGYGLGRFVYLMDAWCDRKKDARKGVFNPIGKDAEWNNVKEMLVDAASEASAALERLPLDQHIQILRNVVYSGIWLRTSGKKEESE